MVEAMIEQYTEVSELSALAQWLENMRSDPLIRKHPEVRRHVEAAWRESVRQLEAFGPSHRHVSPDAIRIQPGGIA